MARHQKATDVSRARQPIFGRKVSFAEAFPSIASVRVEVTESEVAGQPRRRVLDERSLSEYVDCSNPVCYNGSFDIGDVIRRMVSEKETSRATRAMCQGYEGSPKGRKRFRSCLHSFEARVTVAYRPDQPSSGADL
jgi:hypothetical protein